MAEIVPIFMSDRWNKCGRTPRTFVMLKESLLKELEDNPGLQKLNEQIESLRKYDKK